MKKYELTDDTIKLIGKTLYRIKALKSFADVEAGDLGGYIEKEANLSHEGDAWIYNNALVFGNARIGGNAFICDNAYVFGDAWVDSNAHVCSNAWISGCTHVYGKAYICTNAKISATKDYTVIQGFGTECIPTTFYRCVDDKVRVKCGCFSGTIDKFREQVKKTREGKIAKEYLEIADLMEHHFE